MAMPKQHKDFPQEVGFNIARQETAARLEMALSSDKQRLVAFHIASNALSCSYSVQASEGVVRGRGLWNSIPSASVSLRKI